MLLDSSPGDPVVAERSALPRTQARLGVVALAIGLAAFVLHAVTVLQGYFWQDDFLIIQKAAAGVPYDPAFLMQDYNGHISPGIFLLAWVVTAIAPLSYPVAVLPVLAMHAGALLAFWRLLVVCFGPRHAVLVPFTVFALSPIVLFSTLWWAFALQMTPLLLAMAACVDCHVRYLRTRRLGYAVGAVLWMLAGLAFFEKAALFPALLFAVTALLGSGLSSAFTEHRKLWLAYGALIAGYAVIYLTVTSAPPAQPGSVALDTLDYIRRALVDTLLTGLFGGPWSGSAVGMTWPDLSAVVRIAVAVAAVAVVVGGIMVGRRRAVLAWTALAAYIAVDLTLVAMARLPLFGVLIGNDPRFVADVVPVAALLAAFAFLPPAGAPGRIRFALPVTAVTALFAVGAVVSVLALAPGARFTDGRSYVAILRSALSANPDLPLYDSAIPNEMMASWGFGRDATVSKLTALLPVQARFDAPAETLYMIDSTGRPSRIDGLLDTVDGDPGPVADCGWAVTTEPTKVALAEPVNGKRVLLIGYYTADAGEVAVTVAGVDQLIRVEAGLHRISLVVTGAFSRVDIRRTAPAAAVCVGSVQVGLPWVG